MKNTKQTVFELLAKGQFSEVEKICINHPQLREVLLHWKGIRKTAFFKNRLKFYRNFARKSNIRQFTPEVKNQMRDEFAQEHCMKTTLQKVKTATLKGYDKAAFTTEISRIRFNQMLKKRRRRLGL